VKAARFQVANVNGDDEEDEERNTQVKMFLFYSNFLVQKFKDIKNVGRPRTNKIQETKERKRWEKPRWIVKVDVAFQHLNMSHLMKDGGSRCSPTPTKYIHIQSTTVYVPSSELGLSHPFSRQRVRSGGSPN
jgi:hypothetical protein